jgi:hypothetical protein
MICCYLVDQMVTAWVIAAARNFQAMSPEKGIEPMH